MLCMLIFNSLISPCKTDSEIVIQREIAISLGPKFSSGRHFVRLIRFMLCQNKLGDMMIRTLRRRLSRASTGVLRTKNPLAASIALLQPEELLPCT